MVDEAARFAGQGGYSIGWRPSRSTLVVRVPPIRRHTCPSRYRACNTECRKTLSSAPSAITSGRGTAAFAEDLMRTYNRRTLDRDQEPIVALANSLLDALRRILGVLAPQPVPIPIPIRIDGR